jgi:hypothetical protein
MDAQTKPTKGRPKGRFVNTVKKEPTKVVRLPARIADGIKGFTHIEFVELENCNGYKKVYFSVTIPQDPQK